LGPAGRATEHGSSLQWPHFPTATFIYGWDIVTRIPRTWQGFDHVDEAIQLGSRWTWQVLSRRFSDHSIEGYIADLEDEVKAA
jgi:hypothetical protein